jgi:hypothetical protein
MISIERSCSPFSASKVDAISSGRGLAGILTADCGRYVYMKEDMKSGIHKTGKYLISRCKGGVIRKLQALPICIRGVIKAAMKRL